MNLSTSKLMNLSVDELSALYDRIALVLTRRIENEKRKLEQTLHNLRRISVADCSLVRRTVRLADVQRKPRRKYPPVQPKYRNPADRSQTWAGRGKQPKWLVVQLKGGKKIDDFLIKGNPARSRSSAQAADASCEYRAQIPQFCASIDSA